MTQNSKGKSRDYEYYDRAIRCTYNENEKVIWDSFGNCARYQLDTNVMNYQEHIVDIEQPPSWAVDYFSIDIKTFKSDIFESGAEVDINEATAQRLEELGYL